MATVENISIAVKTTGADTAARRINSLVGALEQLEKATAQMTGLQNLASLGNAVSTLSNSRVSISIFNSMSKGIENLSAALKTITAENITNLKIIASTLSGLNNVNLGGLGNASNISKAANSLRQTANGIKEVGKEATKAESPLGNFINSLKRIAFYRMIRTVIKEITKAIKEGIDNLYEYSKAHNDFAGISSSLDGLASAAQTTKNQLGATFGQILAAAAPILIELMNLVRQLTQLFYPLAQAISALAPVINAVISVVTELVNVLIKLFDLLGMNVGKVVADNATASWKKAKKAAGDYKRTILGFDEINRLNGPSGGGTDNGGFSGGTSPIDSKPFEFKNFEWLSKFKDDINSAIGAVRDLVAELALIPEEVIIEVLEKDKATEPLNGLVRTVEETFPVYATVVMAIEGNPIPFIQTVRAAIAKFVKNSAASFKEWQTAYAKACSTVSKESYSLAGNLKTAFAKDKEAAQSWIEHFWQKVGEYQRACGALELENSTLEKDTTDVFNRLKNPLNDWVSHAWQKVGEYQQAGSALQLENATLASDVSLTYSKVRDSIRTALDNAKVSINTFKNETLPAWSAWAQGVVTNAASAFSGVAQNVYSSLSNAAQNVVAFANGAGSAIYQWANGALNTVSSWATSVASKIGSGLSRAWSKVKSFAESLGAALPGTYTSTYDNGITFVTVNPVIPSISLFPYIGGGMAAIPAFAEGGMPSVGSLFWAGEHGAEIVANMNSGTGVLNIEQMREAIKDGMLEAMSVKSGDGKTELHVYLDSREIKYGQSRLARAMGV